MRWGLGRGRYSIAPGLYAIGSPNTDSHVLVEGVPGLAKTLATGPDPLKIRSRDSVFPCRYFSL